MADLDPSLLVFPLFFILNKFSLNFWDCLVVGRPLPGVEALLVSAVIDCSKGFLKLRVPSSKVIIP